MTTPTLPLPPPRRVLLASDLPHDRPPFIRSAHLMSA
jgi:hypothetical protein